MDTPMTPEATPQGEFISWFLENYPPACILSNPAWHAPKIYRAATCELERRLSAALAREEGLRKAQTEAVRLHGLVDQLASRFKGYLPWPEELRDSVVKGHEKFIEDTIKKADAAIDNALSHAGQEDKHDDTL